MDFHRGEAIYFYDSRLKQMCDGWIENFTGSSQTIQIRTIIDGKVQLRNVDRSQRVFLKSDFGHEGFSNMVTMSELSDLSILLNLQIRYNIDFIYTNIGSILVSINPYKEIDMYGPKDVARYRNQIDPSLPAHLYMTADSVYRAMMEKKESQTVIISGESGSGKTENFKRMLSYLALVSESRGSQRSRMSTSQQILRSTPLLESFGNAKTVRNNNSSRFGKYVEIDFVNGVIVGGRITNYLLEKSRVVQPSTDERNYHVFYEVLEGLTPDEKSRHGLKNATDYNYLSHGHGSQLPSKQDSEDFRNILSNWEVLGFHTDDFDICLRIISAILHLGNILFLEDEDVSALLEHENIAQAAKELQVDKFSLINCLTCKSMETVKENFRIPVNAAQALSNRDTLAKNLYLEMFAWLVEKINARINTRSTSMTAYVESESTTSIAMLDIYGFEDFPTNSFEQLCINFANETLQFFFNRHVFKLEQSEYTKEGISWVYLDYTDNTLIINLLTKSPHGIFHLLDDEAHMPKGSDASFLTKCHRQHQANIHYKAPPGNNLQFTIVHFAGSIAYDVHDFVEKNRDALRPETIQLLSHSKNTSIAALFSRLKEAKGGASGQGRGSRKKLRNPTVAAEFSTSLNTLIEKMGNCQPWFIRCIKPNNFKMAASFHTNTVLEQLRYTGILETVKIRKTGYPIRLTYEAFFKRYSCLMPAKSLQVLAATPRRSAVQLLTRIVQHHRHTHPDAAFDQGKTKLFLKESLCQLLDQATLEATGRAIVTLQKWVRRFLARRRYIRMQEAAVLIQYRYRKFVRTRARFNGTANAAYYEPEMSRSPRQHMSDGRVNVSLLDIPVHLAFLLDKARDVPFPHTDNNLVHVPANRRTHSNSDRSQSRNLPPDVDRYKLTHFLKENGSKMPMGYCHKPLVETFLPNRRPKEEKEPALNAFKLILRLLNDSKMSTEQEFIIGCYLYHMALSNPAVQEEIYLQLISQSINHEGPPSLLWMHIANLLSCSAPSPRLYPYVLKFVSDQSPDEYSALCQEKALRCQRVSRAFPPTMLEWKTNKKCALMMTKVEFPDGKECTLPVESFTTAETLAKDALLTRMDSYRGMEGWSMQLEYDECSWIVESGGHGYVLDPVASMEMPPHWIEVGGARNAKVFLVSRKVGSKTIAPSAPSTIRYNWQKDKHSQQSRTKHSRPPIYAAQSEEFGLGMMATTSNPYRSAGPMNNHSASGSNGTQPASSIFFNQSVPRAQHEEQWLDNMFSTALRGDESHGRAGRFQDRSINSTIHGLGDNENSNHNNSSSLQLETPPSVNVSTIVPSSLTPEQAQIQADLEKTKLKYSYLQSSLQTEILKSQLDELKTNSSTNQEPSTSSNRSNHHPKPQRQNALSELESLEIVTEDEPITNGLISPTTKTMKSLDRSESMKDRANSIFVHNTKWPPREPTKPQPSIEIPKNLHHAPLVHVNTVPSFQPVPSTASKKPPQATGGVVVSRPPLDESGFDPEPMEPEVTKSQLRVEEIPRIDIGKRAKWLETRLTILSNGSPMATPANPRKVKSPHDSPRTQAPVPPPPPTPPVFSPVPNYSEDDDDEGYEPQLPRASQKQFTRPTHNPGHKQPISSRYQSQKEAYYSRDSVDYLPPNPIKITRPAFIPSPPPPTQPQNFNATPVKRNVEKTTVKHHVKTSRLTLNPETRSLMYTNVPWTLRVRKEYLAPDERIESPLIVDLLFAQIVADLYENPCIRLQSADRLALNQILNLNQPISKQTLNNVSFHKKKLVLEAAKKMDFYFGRFYAVKPIKNSSSSVRWLVVSHSSIKLANQHLPEGNDGAYLAADGLSCDRSIRYSKIKSVEVRSDEAIIIIHLEGETIEFKCSHAVSARDLIERFRSHYIKAQANRSISSSQEVHTISNHQQLHVKTKSRNRTRIHKKIEMDQSSSSSASRHQGDEKYGIEQSVFTVSRHEPVHQSSTRVNQYYRQKDVSGEVNSHTFQTVSAFTKTSQHQYHHHQQASSHFDLYPFAKERFRSRSNEEELLKNLRWNSTPLSVGLINCSNKEDNKLAVESCIAIMTFMDDYPKEAETVDLHYVYLLLKIGKSYPHMIDEIYCQLCQQTTDNRSENSSSLTRGWKLFSIMAMFFPCSEQLKPYLLTYLQRHATNPVDPNPHAAVTLQNLKKSIIYGGRKNLPLKMELNSIVKGRLLKRQLISLPNSGGTIIPLRPIATVEDVIIDLCTRFGVVTPREQAEFSLFHLRTGDNMVVLKGDVYVFDVVTKDDEQGVESEIYFSRTSWHEELLLDSRGVSYIDFLFNQLRESYMSGDWIVAINGRISEEHENEIVQLTVLAHRGQKKDSEPQLDDISALLPKGVDQLLAQNPRKWIMACQQMFTNVARVSPQEAQKQFMNILSHWPLFGSTCFIITPLDPSPLVTQSTLLLAVNRSGVHFLKISTHEPIIEVGLSDIVAFSVTNDRASAPTFEMKCDRSADIRFTAQNSHKILHLLRQYIRVRTLS